MFLRDLPKPLKESTLVLNKFTGGLNNKSSDTVLNEDEPTDSENMKFLADGLMETRDGTLLVTDFMFDPDTDDLIFTWKDIYKPINLTHLAVEATDTVLYIGGLKICDVLGQVKGVNYNGNYFFVDGTNLYQYDGTTVYTIVQPPEEITHSSSAAAQAVIVLDGWDARIVANMQIQIESLAGVETKTILSIDEATKTITCTANLTYTHAIGSLIRFYVPLTTTYFEGLWKTDNVLDLKWYEPCKNELDDEYKGENYIPQKCNIICLHNERLYVAGDDDNPSDIYLSDINNPYYFPVFLGTNLPMNSDKIIDIVEFDNGLIVGRTLDIYSITGNTNDVASGDFFIQKKLDVHTGFKTINNASVGNNYLFFLGYDENIYTMSVPYNSPGILKTNILNKNIDLHKIPFSAIATDFTRCPGVFFNNEYMFLLGDKIIVYSYLYNGFTYYTGTKASILFTDGLKLYIGRTDGLITVYDEETFTDNGIKIESRWSSKRFDCGSPINYKYFRSCFALSHVFDSFGGTVKIAFEIDLRDIDAVYQSIDSMSRFGFTAFGDKFITRNIVQSSAIPIEDKGRLIRFHFYNDILGERMRIYSLNTLFTMRDTR